MRIFNKSRARMVIEHHWEEPLENAETRMNKDSLDVLMLEIGEVVKLK